MQGVDPEDVSLEQAVELLAAKAARMQAKAAKVSASSTEPGKATSSKKPAKAKATGTSKHEDAVSTSKKSAKREGGTAPKRVPKAAKARRLSRRQQGPEMLCRRPLQRAQHRRPLLAQLANVAQTRTCSGSSSDGPH